MRLAALAIIAVGLLGYRLGRIAERLDGQVTTALVQGLSEQVALADMRIDLLLRARAAEVTALDDGVADSLAEWWTWQSHPRG